MSNKVSRSALRKRNTNAIEVKVTLLGLDRTSGSIGFGLRSYSERPDTRVVFKIIGRDLDNETMKAAQKLGLIDNFHRNLENALEDADIVFINEPLSELQELFERSATLLKPGVVLIDLSRLKQPAIDYANRYFPRDEKGKSPFYLVGATPLVGFENLYNTNFSIEASREFMFRGCDMLIVPNASVPPEAVKVVTDIAEFLSMKPRFMDPAEHDALASIVDGLPTMLAMALFQTVHNSPGSTDIFRASNSEFAIAVQSLRHVSARDMVLLWQNNRDSLIHHIDAIMATLTNMRQLLEEEQDPEVLQGVLETFLKAFVAWEVRREQNRWDDPQDNAYDNIDIGISNLIPGFGGRLSKRRQEDD
ncbi:MAG: hypothetical protein CUN55_13595 [Phototrophicales bacterium]|nr:MAG: hypothetical protein CUN55_13595 [Phototrophicales bacterium]